MDSIPRYILEKVREGAIDKQMAARMLVQLKQGSREEPLMAIIGMACQLPGANGLQAFWDVVASGENQIRSFPAQRRADIEGLSSTGFAEGDFFRGGFLDRIDEFDAEYFRISPLEARLMDPYQRLMLMKSVEAIENAGYSCAALAGSNLGIFIGTDHTHKLMVSYNHLLGDSRNMLGITGSCSGILASRLSYILDVRGPALVIDTSCSSGLVALHSACRALAGGECDVALAGGINVFLCPVDTGRLSEVESARAELRAFDRQAAGTVWGEGVVALLVKPLKRALADGDPIHAVIRGSAVNNDGASNGITAPRAESQTDVIQAAWKQAGIHPETLGLFEAHGTGTLLGDPIEVKGLTAAFREHTEQRQFCAISSVKSCIGHTVGASGLASVVRAVLAMQQEKLPPSACFSDPNPFISFIDSPVYVNDCLRDWPRGAEPRRAAVTALGFNGTNCHVVLEERPATESAAPARDGAEFFALSARSEASLRALKLAIRQALLDRPELHLRQLCCTLATGRAHHPFRFGRVVRSRAELLAELEAVDEQSEPTAVSSSTSERRARQQELRDLLLQRAEGARLDEASLHRLAQEYCRGTPIDWTLVYPDRSEPRVHLPPTPFELQRFWPDSLAVQPRPSAAAAALAEEPALELVGRPRGEYSELERAVARLLASALGHRRLDTQLSFYALGGDSILAMNVVNALEKSTSFRVDASELLRSASLDAFLQRVQQLRDSAADSSSDRAPQIARLSPQPHYALSSSQRRIFALNRMDEGDLRYNMPVAFEIRGPLESARLEAAIRAVVARHDVLRASFHVHDGEPACVVHDEVDFELEQGSATREELASFTRRFIRPFELEQAPLFRAALFRSGEASSLLLLDMHHLVADGTSVEILVREVMALYRGKALLPLPVQYQDFAAWHNAWLESDTLRTQERYWLERFATGVPRLELSPTFTRPPLQSFAGDRVLFTAERELVDQLDALAKGNRCTLYMVLLAAFNVVLHKYTGDADIVVGTPTAGRHSSESEALVGVFINTLSLRNRPRAEITFERFLSEVRADTLDAFANQQYPFEQLVDKLNLPRDLGRNPLFDVMFAMQPSRPAEFEVAGLQWRGFNLENRTAKFDLSLQAVKQGDELHFELEFCTDLFSAAFARRMTGHFLNVLNEVVRDPQRKIGSIQILSASEHNQIVYAFNDTERDFDRDDNVVECIRRAARQWPERAAVSFNGREQSYAELDDASERIAHSLRERGVSAGDVVAVLLQPSLALLPVLLGILKAGAAYLPLDPAYPPERIAFMLRDSGARFAVSDSTPRTLVSSAVWSHFRELLEPARASKPLARIPAGDTAYVIYTSGSTGEPKGVVVSHANLRNFVEGARAIADYSPGRRVLSLNSVCFDVFALESWLPLAFGLSVVLVDSETRLDARRLAALIRDQRVEIMQATPSRLRALLTSAGQTSDYASLDTILVGGEAFPAALLEQLRRVTSANIYNVYGPTEATVQCTSALMLPSDPVIHIGRPSANTRVYVVDASGNLCPIAIAGELCIAGEGVAQGYHARPELTRERFVTCPFGAGGRMYRSGDLARWREDGSIELLGRLDHQVKLRGYRIELGEIEAELQRCGAKAAAVVKRTSAEGSESLAAFFTADTPLALDTLREGLGERLPKYMVPQWLKQLERLPLTGAGKIDRIALLALDCEAERAHSADPCSSPAELALAAVLKKTLRVAEVRRGDDYFALGGDSIRAIQVAASLRDVGYELKVRDIIRSHRVDAIARCMQPVGAVRANARVIQRAALMPFQQSLLAQAGKRVQHYNLSFMLDARQRFDVKRLETVLDSLAQRHSALSLSFELSPDPAKASCFRRSQPGRAWVFEEVDVRESPAPERRIELTASAFQRRLSVEKGLVFGACLFHGPRTDHLLLVVHQLVMDHVSFRFLLDDLVAGYTAPGDHEPSRDEGPDGYLEWLDELQSLADSPTTLAELPYWRAVDEARTSRLPVDRPNGSNKVRDVSSLWRPCLDVRQTARFLELSSRSGAATLNASLLLALGRALHRVDGGERHCLDLGGHGRQDIGASADVSRTIGRFTNLYPFVLELEPKLEVGEQLAKIRRDLDAVPRGGVGYGLLRYKTQSALRGAPLTHDPELTFSYMGQFDTDFSNELLTFSQLPTGPTVDLKSPRRYRLNVIALVAWQQLQLRIDYSREQYDEGTIQKLAEFFTSELAQVLAGSAELGSTA